jgi:hypothetical protein
VVSDGGIDRGGLYAFGVPASELATVRGRVLDEADEPLAGVMAACEGVGARTEGDGTFVLGPLAAVDARGDARATTIEFIGGRGLRPERTTQTIALVPGEQMVADVVLDTAGAGEVRLLLVERGRPLPQRVLKLSGTDFAAVAGAFAGDDAELGFEELEPQLYGFRDARILDGRRLRRLETTVRLSRGQRRADARAFTFDTDWDDPRRGASVYMIDALGGGPVRGAFLLRNFGSDAVQGETSESGTLFLGINEQDVVTAVHRSEARGLAMTSAFSIAGARVGRAEMPLLRAWRPLGAFDNHALVSGRLTGGSGLPRGRSVRATRPIGYRDFYASVVLGDDSALGRVPKKVDPAAGEERLEFAVGVPAPRGHLGASEGTAVGERRALERVGLLTDVAAVPGELLRRDVAFDLPADGAFTAAGALQGLDARIDRARLRFAYAVELAGGALVDVARDLASPAVTGADLPVSLPPLAGPLQGARHHLIFMGDATDGATAISQALLVSFSGPSETTPGFLPAPVIGAPAPGAVVPAAGFDAVFAAPPGTDFVRVELTSGTAADARSWRALLPGSATVMPFRALPERVPAVLAPNRSWTLTVTAVRVDRGLLAEAADVFARLVPNGVSLGEGALGVSAVSSASVVVTTQ